MADRKPLVVNSGRVAELPAADTLVVNQTTTTGVGMTISVPSLTTGKALNIVGPSGTGVSGGASVGVFNISSDVGDGANGGTLAYFNANFKSNVDFTTNYAVHINAADATSTANILGGIAVDLALSGNAPKTAYAIFGRLTDTSTTADDTYGLNFESSVSGAISSGTRNIYGSYSRAIGTGANTGGTTNIYAGYFSARTSGSSNGSTVKTYSVYAEGVCQVAALSTGVVEHHGVHVANATMNGNGTSTQYGIYVESLSGADTNYGLVVLGGNVGFGTATPAAQLHTTGTVRHAALNTAGIVTNNSSGDLSTVVMSNYLMGLQLVWNSATSISAKPGIAGIQSNGKLLYSSGTITKSSLSLSASTWYYVYYYDNSGSPDLDISTTAPGSAYLGSARSKSGDTSRRLIGFLRTDGSGNVLNFYQSGDQILYRTPSGNSPQRVLSAGNATTYTNVDCSAVIPVNTQIGFFRFTNLATSTVARTKESEGTYGSDYFHAMEGGKQMTSPHPVNASQVMQYKTDDSSGSFYIDVMGYFLELS